MGKPIFILDGKFFVWSTVLDTPITPGLTMGQLEEFIFSEEGEIGLATLPARLDRVAEKGTSSQEHDSVEDLLFLNCMGQKGGRLPVDEALAMIRSWADLEDSAA